MNENRNDDEKLRLMLNDCLPKPSAPYSNHLQNFIVGRYAKKKQAEVRKHLWPARVIVGMTILWNLIFLYLFNPFKGQPVLYLSVLAFILGLWMVIGLIKRQLSITY
jgi:hypothetical protein